MNILLKSLLLGFAFIFLTEGLLLTISPKGWKETVAQIISRSREVLEKIGLGMGITAVIMAAIWHIYPQSFGLTWLGFAMMLLLEGLTFGVFLEYWKKKMAMVITSSDLTLRRMGMLVFSLGCVLFFLANL